MRCAISEYLKNGTVMDETGAVPNPLTGAHYPGSQGY